MEWDEDVRNDSIFAWEKSKRIKQTNEIFRKDVLESGAEQLLDGSVPYRKTYGEDIHTD